MATALLKPILEEIQTIFRATLNTEKDTIDSTLSDVASNNIRIEDVFTKPESYPWLKIFPGNISPVDSETEGVTMTVDWFVVTSIFIQGNNSQDLIKNLDIYLSSMVYSLVKGQTSDWDIDGTADVLKLVEFSHEDFQGAKEGEIVRAGYLTWAIDKEYNIA